MISQYLVGELYKQIKRVLNKPLSITDETGVPYEGAHDLEKIVRYHLAEYPSRDKNSLELQGEKKLRAVPVYHGDKIVCLVVTELSQEDIQMVQIITSLCDLLVLQFVESNKPKPDVVDLLCNRLVYRPHTLEADELEQTLVTLGYRLDVQRVAIIIQLSGFWDNYLQTVGQPHAEKKNLISAKKHDLENSLSSFFSRNQDNVIGYIGEDRFLVLKDLTDSDFDRFYHLFQTNFVQITESLKNIHIGDVKVGVGDPSRTVYSLIQSVEQAAQALDIGTKMRRKKNIFRLDELGVLPLLVSSTVEQKRAYSNRVLSNLRNDEELMETLEIFLEEDLSLTQTASRLNVHRNTVIYRLDKIREWIDRDPRRFSDAVELYLSLTFDKAYPPNP